MPNWCSNELRVDVSDIDMSIHEWMNEVGEFEKDDNGEVRLAFFRFDFNKIIPEPDYEHEDDWCDWREDNWGTKWNAESFFEGEYSPVDYDDENTCEFYFYTAWCPPYGIIEELNEKYVGVSIQLFYREDGMKASGYL